MYGGTEVDSAAVQRDVLQRNAVLKSRPKTSKRCYLFIYLFIMNTQITTNTRLKQSRQYTDRQKLTATETKEHVY